MLTNFIGNIYMSDFLAKVLSIYNFVSVVRVFLLRVYYAIDLHNEYFYIVNRLIRADQSVQLNTEVCSQYHLSNIQDREYISILAGEVT